MPGQAVLHFRPMPDSQFDAWAEASTASYASDLVVALKLSHDEAVAKSRKAFAELFTAGLETPGHMIWRVLLEDTEAGTLWVGPMPAFEGCWIYGIFVDPQFRSRGIGTAALAHCEQWAREQGHAAIGLNVFAHNPRARSLYSRVGYVVDSEDEAGTKMSKPLS